MLKYFCSVSDIEELVFTHMDIIYDEPIKICIAYKKDGKLTEYRPDQEHLKTIEPVYKYFEPWKTISFDEVNDYKYLPKTVKDFIEFVCSYTDKKPALLTYGADQNKTIFL